MRSLDVLKAHEKPFLSDLQKVQALADCVIFVFVSQFKSNPVTFNGRCG